MTAFEEFERREELRKQRAIETVLVTAAEAGMSAKKGFLAQTAKNMQ